MEAAQPVTGAFADHSGGGDLEPYREFADLSGGRGSLSRRGREGRTCVFEAGGAALQENLHGFEKPLVTTAPTIGERILVWLNRQIARTL